MDENLYRMKLEEVERKHNSHPEIKYFLHGYKVEDGIYRSDACACIERKDAVAESKKFVKYVLYKLEKDPNQNL